MSNNPSPWGVSIDVFSASAAGDVAAYDFGPPSSTGGRSVSRAWEAAETTRLNSSHWQDVSDDILQDLRTDLLELQRRTRHESINNSLFDGAIETQQTNVVSSLGPALQILTQDNAFNDQVEAIYAAWAESCEYQEGLAMVDLLEGWVAQYMIYGEVFAREIVGKSVSEYKIFDLGAESIDTLKTSGNVHSGVEVDATGRVVAYHLADPANPMAKSRLPAALALHCYRRRFAQQRRGFPGFASALEPAGQMRDYDSSVDDAARAAADTAIFFVTNHPDAEFTQPTETVLPWRRRVRQYIRPGWDVRQLQAHQPAANYVEFRKERQTDVGGAIEMPWMILRKDASNHNMSSARFDGSRYARAIDRFQARIARRILTLIVRRLVRIAQFEGILPPTPIDPRYETLRFEFPNLILPIAWTWPKPPAVDNLKDATAERIRLENGTLSLSEAIAAEGRRPEETLRLRSRDNAALVRAGLPPILGAVPSSQTAADLLATIAAMDAAEAADNPSAEAADAINAGQPKIETPPIDTATETKV
jgi:lambda family phage portal protein